MADLNTAAESLLRLLDRNVAAAHVALANTFNAVLPSLDWTAETKAAVVAGLRESYPPALLARVELVSGATAVWYDGLAPDVDFSATAPDDVVSEERITESIGWAIRTATTAETALAQLAGSTQRVMLDAQRATVASNAAAEGVRYRRHTNYAGACNWCLVMATRGAIYASATSAVRGHDNCRCIAVPERPGSTYAVPVMVRDAEVRYVEARRQLEATSLTTNLNEILRRMDGQSLVEELHIGSSKQHHN
ncbi:hypothetical protein [Mycolicibacterium sp. S3B2]|uniref:VG15 protein n=1 Tax=Mycolicibacterium sp. S3B2 TaxID=3415120 RepID=UPI003C7E3467